jgi:hypothetical protein
MTRRTCRFAIAFATVCLYGAVPSGPEPGQRVADFRLSDQNGVERTLQSLMGPKGALLVFYRSADW